jgi:hypothetical protein
VVEPTFPFSDHDIKRRPRGVQEASKLSLFSEMASVRILDPTLPFPPFTSHVSGPRLPCSRWGPATFTERQTLPTCRHHGSQACHPVLGTATTERRRDPKPDSTSVFVSHRSRCALDLEIRTLEWIPNHHPETRIRLGSIASLHRCVVNKALLVHEAQMHQVSTPYHTATTPRLSHVEVFSSRLHGVS